MLTKKRLLESFEKENTYLFTDDYELAIVIGDWWLSQFKQILDEIVGEKEDKKYFTLNYYSDGYKRGYNEAKAEVRDRITKLGL